MNQFFNNQVMKIVETDEKYIHTNILVADVKYKFNRKFTLRGELQYLFSNQDRRIGRTDCSSSPITPILWLP